MAKFILGAHCKFSSLFPTESLYCKKVPVHIELQLGFKLISYLISCLVVNLIHTNPTMMMHGGSWEVADPVELISNVIWTAHSNSLITCGERAGAILIHSETGKMDVILQMKPFKYLF